MIPLLIVLNQSSRAKAKEDEIRIRDPRVRVQCRQVTSNDGNLDPVMDKRSVIAEGVREAVNEKGKTSKKQNSVSPKAGSVFSSTQEKKPKRKNSPEMCREISNAGELTLKIPRKSNKTCSESKKSMKDHATEAGNNRSPLHTSKSSFLENYSFRRSNKRRTTCIKRQINHTVRTSSVSEKKKRIGPDLFGESSGHLKSIEPVSDVTFHRSNTDLPSPSLGWAKFKEKNPDEFRTPFNKGRNFKPRYDHFYDDQMTLPFVKRSTRFPLRSHSNLRIDRGLNSEPRPSTGNGVKRPLLATPTEPYENIQDKSVNADPDVVTSQVIPVIVREAQESLRSGRMLHSQFADLMKQVMTLKEQAMMAQAEKRSCQENMLSVPPTNTTGIKHRLDLPLVNSEEISQILSDSNKFLAINGRQSEVRYFGDVAGVVCGNDDIRILSFVAGETRRVVIDNSINVLCPVGNRMPYVDVSIDGVGHQIKIGYPTRELWIDGQWYECYFGNNVQVKLGAKIHNFYLEGPAPAVCISDRCPNICAGKIHLVIDGNLSMMVPIFLDSKPQKIDIAGKSHILCFVDSLKTVLINGHPFKTEFGGVPMVVHVHGEKHFLRLTTLPHNVKAGEVKLWRMNDKNNPQTQTPPQIEPSIVISSSKEIIKHSEDIPMSPLPPSSVAMEMDGHDIAFDKLLMLVNPASNQSSPISNNYMEKNVESNVAYESADVLQSCAPIAANSTVDVHDLWTQLLSAGLVFSPSSSSIPGIDNHADGSDKSKQLELEMNHPNLDKIISNSKFDKFTSDNSKADLDIKQIALISHDKTLKRRQDGVVNWIYDPSALQCKSCGLRFVPTAMLGYSRHLDWHFRLKRREKHNVKRAQSRKWYYDRTDWIMSEEIEDVDKGSAGTSFTSTLVEGDGTVDAEPLEAPTVPVSNEGGGNSCPICHEDFEQFYKDEDYEIDIVAGSSGGRWHLHNAVRIDEVNYHPQCYSDKNDTSINDASLECEINCEETKEVQDVSVKEDVEILMAEKEQVSSNVHEIQAATALKQDSSLSDDVVTDSSKNKNDATETSLNENSVPEVEMMANKVEDDPVSVDETSDVKMKESIMCDDDDSATINVDKEINQESKVDLCISTIVDTIDDQHLIVTDNLIPSVLPVIKMNIKSADVLSTSFIDKAPCESLSVTESDFDADVIIQPAKDEAIKPKLKDRKFINMPMQKKAKEMSGLCSIM